MKTKTAVIGTVLVTVVVGAYFFLIKKKNTVSGTTTSGTGTTSGSESQTKTPPPVTIEQIAINQNQLIEQNKYQQALNIQQKYLNVINLKCAGESTNTSNGFFADSPYKNCINMQESIAYNLIKKEINLLGYKLLNYSPYSKIEKLTL